MQHPRELRKDRHKTGRKQLINISQVRLFIQVRFGQAWKHSLSQPWSSYHCGQTSCWIAHKARAPRPGYRLDPTEFSRISKTIAGRSKQLPATNHHLRGKAIKIPDSGSSTRVLVGTPKSLPRAMPYSPPKLSSARACCGMLESTLVLRPNRQSAHVRRTWYTENTTCEVESLISHDTFRHRSCFCSYSSIGRHRCFCCCRPLMSRTTPPQFIHDHTLQ